MAPYLVHRSRERARIRHEALVDPETQARVFEFLKGEGGIAGIKPGGCSFLLLLEPAANLDQICAELEGAFPFFRAGAAVPAPATPARKPHSRRCRLLTLLTCGLTTVGLAATGLKHWHAAVGCVFALLATDHVWQRRKAL